MKHCVGLHYNNYSACSKLSPEVKKQGHHILAHCLLDTVAKGTQQCCKQAGQYWYLKWVNQQGNGNLVSWHATQTPTLMTEQTWGCNTISNFDDRTELRVKLTWVGARIALRQQLQAQNTYLSTVIQRFAGTASDAKSEKISSSAFVYCIHLCIMSLPNPDVSCTHNCQTLAGWWVL